MTHKIPLPKLRTERAGQDCLTLGRSDIQHAAYSPLARDAAERRLLKMFGVSDGVAEFAAFVEAAGERSWSSPARTCLSFAITASVFAIASSTASSTVAIRACSSRFGRTIGMRLKSPLEISGNVVPDD